MGQIACPEPSVQNYHSTLRNIPEERKSQGKNLVDLDVDGKMILKLISEEEIGKFYYLNNLAQNKDCLWVAINVVTYCHVT